MLPSVDAAAPQEGRFEAHWAVEGTREELQFGSGPSHSIFRHTGNVAVLRSDGAVGNALSKCIGLSDASTGSSSRCIWVDANGDEIFTEIQRDAPSPNRTGRGRGRIVGGTGPSPGSRAPSS